MHCNKVAKTQQQQQRTWSRGSDGKSSGLPFIEALLDLKRPI